MARRPLVSQTERMPLCSMCENGAEYTAPIELPQPEGGTVTQQIGPCCLEMAYALRGEGVPEGFEVVAGEFPKSQDKPRH